MLVTGGLAMPFVTTSLAAMMVHSLQDDFGVPVRWEEDNSYDTWENAEYSARILHDAGISRIYLVTHFWHMRRADDRVPAFWLGGHTGAGAAVIAAAAVAAVPGAPGLSAWDTSYLALHEWSGLLYYSLRR